MKTALVTGITGQDGAYMAQLLLGKGYKVFGAVRRSSGNNLWRLETLGIRDQVALVSCDLSEDSNTRNVIERTMPDEVYNLAAQSFVKESFLCPIYTADIDAIGVLRLLEAIRVVNPKIRFYQASSSEMFGKVVETPQKESTPFYPRSPYGVAKLYAHWTTVNHRESFGLHASSGIAFNHESPLRGLEFVTRKIINGLVRFSKGLQTHIELGNIDAYRDWGFAGDYVDGMWRMLQQPSGGDYVLSTGVMTNVREFVGMACAALGLPIEWHGSGLLEQGVLPDGTIVVKINPEFYRPAEVELLLGESSKARLNLGWVPKHTVRDLVNLMVTQENVWVNQQSSFK